jgi:transketolase
MHNLIRHIVKALKENLGWPSMEPFYVPEDVYDNYKKLSDSKIPAYDAWNRLFKEYCGKFPEMKDEWDREFDLGIADKLIDDEKYWSFDEKADATRNLSGAAINKLKTIVPSLIGGAADLAPSTKTYMKDMGDFSKDNYLGRNMHFGVREIAMAAICNGITLSGLRGFGATFFVFSVTGSFKFPPAGDTVPIKVIEPVLPLFRTT